MVCRTSTGLSCNGCSQCPWPSPGTGMHCKACSFIYRTVHLLRNGMYTVNFNFELEKEPFCTSLYTEKVIPHLFGYVYMVDTCPKPHFPGVLLTFWSTKLCAKSLMSNLFSRHSCRKETSVVHRHILHGRCKKWHSISNRYRALALYSLLKEYYGIREWDSCSRCTTRWASLQLQWRTSTRPIRL